MIFSIWWIKFLYKTYRDIKEENISNLFNELELFIQDNNCFLINSYIFTSYKDNQDINKFIQWNRVNLIYSKEENNFNIQLFYCYRDNKNSFEKLSNFWINIKNDFVQLLFLNDITFDNWDFKHQTEEMYKLIFKESKRFWYNKYDFIKAWNFIEDILLVYKDFNEVRDKHFLKEKIKKDYPAGTWIDCLLPLDIQHSSSYFFLKDISNKMEIISLNNDLQCEAYDYWPKFSRAKLIKSKIDNNDVLFISWTAAVDNEGNSIYTNDIEKNIQYTFKSIQNLLEKAWMSFENIASSFVYLKKKDYYNCFLDVYKKNKFQFPYIYNFCNICREDFLFEIEIVAVKKY